MNLLLIEPEEVDEAGLARVEGERAAHVRDVLKLRRGDTVRVGVVDGARGLARLQSDPAQSVTLALDLRSEYPPAARLDLLLALPRPKVLKRLYAPLASLGVRRLFLTNGEKVERSYFDSHAITPAVYRPRLLEGLAQARDTRLPEVRVVRRLKPFVEDELDELCSDARCALADPVYKRSAYGLASRVPQSGRVLLALGPEGGWSVFERDLFERAGFVGVGLGPRTLRTDIATIALVALVHEGLRG